MDSFETGRLIYLAVLGGALLLWFLLYNRSSLNKTLQHISVWVLIFVGTIAAYGLWGDIRRDAAFLATVDDQAGTVSVPRAPDGHYYLTLTVNNAPVRFVIDTGATDIVLSRADAQAVGIDLANTSFHRTALTANGEVRVAPVTLDTVSVGPISDRNVRASVNDGRMEGSLLGMSYLQRFEKIEITGGKLVLTR